MKPGSEELDHLIATAKREPPPPSEHGERLWQRVEQRLAQGPAADPLGAGGSLAAKWVISGLAAAAVGGAAWAWLAGRAPDEPLAAARVAPVVEPPTPALAPEPPAAVPTPTAVVAPQIEAPPPLEERASPRPRRAKPGAPTVADLGEEGRLLRLAQQALGRNDLAGARRALVGYDRKFRPGELADLRGALEVELLCQEGRTDQAERKRAALQQARPDSPVLARLRAGCTGRGEK